MSIVIGRVAGLFNNLSNGPGGEVWPVNLNPATAVLGHDVGTAGRLGYELTVECHERLVKRLAQITGSHRVATCLLDAWYAIVTLTSSIHSSITNIPI